MKSHWEAPPIALFRDGSLPWVFLCTDTLDRMKVPYLLMSAGDIVEGLLDRHRVLLVPGGWASHKMAALGEEGAGRIKSFVRNGGSYFGFCGGAGLALSGSAGLGLISLERVPLSERLPSASGEVWIRAASNHPAWKDLPDNFPVSVWWPSQFSLHPTPGILCLATYQAAGADFWVADLPVSDLDDASSFEEWEKIYGINLSPRRLIGHQAILEAGFGKGRMVLSYPHLETPGDSWANRLFFNLLRYLDAEAARRLAPRAAPEIHERAAYRFHERTITADSHNHTCGRRRPGPGGPHHGLPPLEKGGRGGFDSPPGDAALKSLLRAKRAADDLISFGERHLLWKWRNPWLLHWRRGIRGLEYGTLAVVLRRMLDAVNDLRNAAPGVPGKGPSPDPWFGPMKSIEEDVRAFCPLAKRLLLEEKLAIQSGNLTKLGRVNQRVDELRFRLFGKRMDHGGMCREIFDELDDALLRLMRSRQSG